MSRVTNVILSFSVLEPKYDVLQRVNAFFKPEYSTSYRGFIVPDNDLWYGGTKFLERPTYLGAFNNFNADKFMDFLETIDWIFPYEVQIFICEQDDNGYYELNIGRSSL